MTLSLLPLTAQADTWLCLGEQAAAIPTKNGVVSEGIAGPGTSFKFLVTDDGLREFDKEFIVIPQCDFQSSGVIICYSVDLPSHHFGMTPERIFRYISIKGGEDGNQLNFVMIIGKCSKI